MRAVVYSRYSTDLQSGASIEDQIRICLERIEREGWTFVRAYQDRAMSGASHLRPGYQKLLEDSRRGEFDVVVSESLDRLSRDQEHVAHLYKHLTFSGVKLLTLSEGWISQLHVGLSGTMGALYLKQLAEKTYRGLRGRVEAGKSGGGLTYGYNVVRRPRPDGTFDVGDRRINEMEATVVRRIFEAYTSGVSPRNIALMLNKDGIPGPRGRGWGASTINGNSERGTGIINNKLYIGKLVWNKLKYLKDPETGRRRSRVNDASAVIERSVPELRIVDDELWKRVKQRQREVKMSSAGKTKKPWERRRPRYLLSGLAKCGSCGGSYVMISQTHLGCATSRNKGLCGNRQTISRASLEGMIIEGLKKHLMAPDLFKEFCEEFLREVNRARQSANADRASSEAELATTKKRQRQIVEAIVDGVPARSLKDELLALEAREDELKARLASEPERKVLLNPNMAELYRARVSELHEALAQPDGDKQAFEAIRLLIERVVITPVDGKLTIDLHGQIAAILRLSAEKRAGDVRGPIAEQLVVVAGVGFEPTTFRL